MRKRSRFGWMELIIGILLAGLGILTFIKPGGILTGIIVIYGLIAVITGIADMIFYIRMERHMGFAPTLALIAGVLSVMAGLMLLIYPGIGEGVISILFPLWFITHCVSRLSHLGIVRITAGKGYYYFTMLVNVIGLIVGIMMIVQPAAAILAVNYLIGFYLLLLGIDNIVLALSPMGYEF